MIDGAHSHIGRLRAISLAQCAVETSTLRGAAGREVVLHVPAGPSWPASRVSAVVSGELRALELGGGSRCEGVELALLHVDRSFFPLLAAAQAAARSRSASPAAAAAPPPAAASSAAPAPPAHTAPAPSPAAPAAVISAPPAARSATASASPEPQSGETLERERRRAERRSAHIPVRLWSSGIELAGTVLNISPYGAFVATESAIELQTAFHVELELPGRTYHYEGIVVNRRSEGAGPSGLGVRFVSLEEALQGTSLDASRLRPSGLCLDLSDPALLAKIYLAEVRHGGLSIPASERYLAGTELRVELLLPTPHAAHSVRAAVLPWNGEPNRLALELLEPAAVKELLRAVIREHRPR